MKLGVLVISVLFAITLGGAKKVEKVYENGVEIIHNQIEPYKLKGAPSNVTLNEEFSINIEDIEEKIGYISGIDANKKGNIYLLDTQLLKIIVLDNKGKFLREFGRDGIGPGEFRAPTSIQINSPGEIVISDYSNRRFSFFQENGKLIKDTKFLFAAEGFVLDNGNFFFKRTIFPRSKVENFKYSLKLYNSNLEEIKELDEIETYTPFSSKIIASDYDIAIAVNGNKIFVGIPNRGYELRVYDFPGKLLRKIQKKVNPIPMTPEYQKAYPERFGKTYEIIKNKVVFPETLPPFYKFSVDNEGRVFVMTYEKDIRSQGYMMDIFDKDGIFISRTVFKFSPYCKGVLRAANNRLYFIYEQEDGSQRLICYKIT